MIVPFPGGHSEHFDINERSDFQIIDWQFIFYNHNNFYNIVTLALEMKKDFLKWAVCVGQTKKDNTDLFIRHTNGRSRIVPLWHASMIA